MGYCLQSSEQSLGLSSISSIWSSTGLTANGRREGPICSLWIWAVVLEIIYSFRSIRKGSLWEHWYQVFSMFILESDQGADKSGRESSDTTVKTTGIVVSQSMAITTYERWQATIQYCKGCSKGHCNHRNDRRSCFNSIPCWGDFHIRHLSVLREFHDCHNVLLHRLGSQPYKIRSELRPETTDLGDYSRSSVLSSIWTTAECSLHTACELNYYLPEWSNGVGIAALALFFPISLICDWSLIAPVFTIIYYVLQKKQKEDLSLILIPASYLILRTIFYTETWTEYVTGTISIFLTSMLIFAFSKKVENAGKRRIPGLVFYTYYPMHLTVIWGIQRIITISWRIFGFREYSNRFRIYIANFFEDYSDNVCIHHQYSKADIKQPFNVLALIVETVNKTVT